MASGAPIASMDASSTPAVRRAPSGASPPAKRLTPVQPIQNATEQAIFDAMEDHATKLDAHQNYIRTLAVAYKHYEQQDTELREKLKRLDDLLAQLESQVVGNEARLAARSTSAARCSGNVAARAPASRGSCCAACHPRSGRALCDAR